MNTSFPSYLRALTTLLATLVVALAATASASAAAPPQPGPTDLVVVTGPAELTAWVTVDCEDFTDPIRVHVTNHTAEPQSVEINDGVGYSWTLDPGETRQGPVWFHPIEMDSAFVQVSAKDGPVFFDEFIPFDHACFGPSPDYSVNLDCVTGIATVLFTNYAITPTTVGVVYPPQPPNDFEYITHISPVEVVLDVSPGETVPVEFYGDGHVMFNGDISFACPEAEVAVEPPAPDVDFLRHLLQQLRVVLYRTSLMPRW